MSHSRLSPIIIDPGSNTLKMGTIGDTPATNIASVVGVPKGTTTIDAASMIFGDEAIAKRANLELHNIYQYNKVANWQYMEAFLTHVVFRGLRTDPEGKVYVIAEPAKDSRGSENRLAAVLFHQFAAAAVAFVPAPILALAASGRTTGVVVSCGAQVTEVAVVKDGVVLLDSVSVSKIAGDTITEELVATMRGGTGGQIDEVVANDIKRKLCYVANDFDQEKQKVTEVTKEYKLIDGTSIKLGLERFVPPELYFNPGLRFNGPEFLALPDLVQKAIATSEESPKPELCSNIVMSGGSSMLQGLPERLESELSALLSSKPKVHAPLDRSYSVWVGGSRLASKAAFRNHFVTLHEFKEKGFRVVREKAAIPIKLS